MSRKHSFHLTKTELETLKRAHRRTRSKRKSYRLNALVLLGQGWTYVQVSEALLIDVSSLQNYVKRYQDGGIPALLKDDYPENASKLTDAECRELEQHLREITYRRVEDIIEWVEAEFDVTFSRSGMTALLHRLGFSYKKPRKVPGKANQEEQAEFIESYKKLRKSLGEEDHVVFIDGVHPQHNSMAMSGWIKKGESKPLKGNTQFHRLNILGAIDIDTYEMTSQMSATLNEDVALDFLEKLRRKYPAGHLYVVLDNAGYFSSLLFKRYAESMAITLVYLPAYSPNLNLIERVWLYFQKTVLYNRYYPTFSQFKYACEDFFRNFRKHQSAMRSLLTEKFETLPV